MPMFLQEPLHTMAATFIAIQRGEDPWVALGNFSNEWFIYARDRRAELVADPPPLIATTTLCALDEKRWSTFIAASTEYLCIQSAIPCPFWLSHLHDRLMTPWYDVVYLDQEIQRWLEETTPESFKRRNIYCGDKIFLDKSIVVHNFHVQNENMNKHH
jgi:hypothetical protein